MTAEKRIYLVDAHAYLHRAYHALHPTQLRNAAGEPVWALFGFAKMLLGILKRENPEYMAVCFDLPEPTFRHEKFKEYKATRKKLDEDLIVQLDRAQEMVRAMGIPAAALPGYEADDLLATLARKAVEKGIRAVLVTGDKDALQLVGDGVAVYNESKGELYDADGVAKKLKVSPGQVVDYLAIVGDSSDNVPGVPGIGAVGAVKLLSRFGSLENAISAAKRGDQEIKPKAAESLIKSEKTSRLGRELIRLDDKAPLRLSPADCRAEVKATPELVELFSRYGFKSILNSLGAKPLEAAVAPALALSASRKTAPRPRVEMLAPKEMAMAVQESPMAAVWVEAAPELDLLTASSPQVALALPDGRCGAFLNEDFKRYRGTLAKILGSSSVKILGYDLKAAMRLLLPEGIEIAEVFGDAMLAAYCLDPSRGKYDLEDIIEDAAAIEDDDRASALAKRASAVWLLHKRFDAELKAGKLEKLYREFELPMLRVLFDMETAGVAVDRQYLRKLSAEFERDISAIKKEVDVLAGVEINLSSPKQLADLFIEKLKLPVVHKTKKGGVSTDEAALRVWAGRHPIPAKIIDYRELTKLKSTYVDALMQKADPATGRVHSHFNQAGTATGRLSSLDPNLQNIPVRTAAGRKIRRAFVAGKGGVLLAADYSQIDLRVLAHLSGDEVLCGAFRSGEDIHLKTAGEVFGLDPENVDPEMRRRAKAVNFGIVYGQSAHGLSQELGIAHGKAKRYIEDYFARYSGVEAWIAGTLESARKDGHVRTMSGRVRFLPDILARNFQLRSFTERVAVNTPIQGTSADIIKAAMINIHRRSIEKGWKARLVLQVHDELIFELPQGEVRDFGVWVRAEMEAALKLSVPLVVDLKSGKNLSEMKAVGA